MPVHGPLVVKAVVAGFRAADARDRGYRLAPDLLPLTRAPLPLTRQVQITSDWAKMHVSRRTATNAGQLKVVKGRPS